MRCRSLEAQLSAVAAMALPTVFSGSPRTSSAATTNGNGNANAGNLVSLPVNGNGNTGNVANASAVAAAASVAAAAAQAAAAFAFELPHPMTASAPSSPSSANKSGTTSLNNGNISDEQHVNIVNGAHLVRSNTPTTDTHSNELTPKSTDLPLSASSSSLDTLQNGTTDAGSRTNLITAADDGDVDDDGDGDGDGVGGMVDHFHFDSEPSSPAASALLWSPPSSHDHHDHVNTTASACADNTVSTRSLSSSSLPLPPSLPSMPPPLPNFRPPAPPSALSKSPQSKFLHTPHDHARPLPSIPSPLAISSTSQSTTSSSSVAIVDNWLEAAGIIDDFHDTSPPPLPVGSSSSLSSTSIAHQSNSHVSVTAAATPPYLHHYHHSPTRAISSSNGVTTLTSAATSSSSSSSFSLSTTTSFIVPPQPNRETESKLQSSHLSSPQSPSLGVAAVNDIYHFDSPSSEAFTQSSSGVSDTKYTATSSVWSSHDYNGLTSLGSLDNTMRNSNNNGSNIAVRGVGGMNGTDDYRSRSSSVSTSGGSVISGFDSISDEIHHDTLPTFTDRLFIHSTNTSAAIPSIQQQQQQRRTSAIQAPAHQPNANAPFITSVNIPAKQRRISATMTVSPPPSGASFITVSPLRPPSLGSSPGGGGVDVVGPSTTSTATTAASTARLVLPILDMSSEMVSSSSPSSPSSSSSPLSPMLPVAVMGQNNETFASPNTSIATPVRANANGVLAVAARSSSNNVAKSSPSSSHIRGISPRRGVATRPKSSSPQHANDVTASTVASTMSLSSSGHAVTRRQLTPIGRR
jgi:hypothetical protein